MTSVVTQAYGPWAGGFHWWFPLIPLAWFLVFWLVVFLVARRFWWRGGWGPHRAAQSAEAVLGQRFAEGQIDEREYRERLAVLRASTPGRG
ncbi:hypothetical protein [Oryzihumus sp.]|uniref:SHOCT domain-containing protein n=1 Tax=Oryzihumus sp. TaxID=1968903 RepID=UPI002ED9E3BC